MKKLALAAVVLFLAACPEKKKAEPAPRAQPNPLEPLERVTVADAGDDREAIFRVVPFTPVGPAVPGGAQVVELDGEAAKSNGKPFALAEAKPPLLLVPVGETYLSQAAATLAALDDANVEVWLKHPDAPLAFKLELRDEPAFQAWLDEPVAGKLRVIHRADGFELQTNMGKLMGGDPNGPTIPVRGGVMDLTTLRRGLERVQGRFKSAPDYCFVPSFGMELAQVARAMSPNYLAPDSAYFSGTCLVYPRPKKQ